MRMSREHDPDEPAEKRSKTVTNLAGITGEHLFPFERRFTFSPKVLEVTQVRSRRDKQNQQASWVSIDLVPLLLVFCRAFNEHCQYVFLGTCDAGNVCPFRLYEYDI